jgi:hypothetical protein
MTKLEQQAMDRLRSHHFVCNLKRLKAILLRPAGSSCLVVEVASDPSWGAVRPRATVRYSPLRYAVGEDRSESKPHVSNGVIRQVGQNWPSSM